MRQIAPLRQSGARRTLASIAAATGTGYLGIKGLHWLRTKNVSGVGWEVLTGFDTWADDLWKQCAPLYPLIADRSAATLNVLYPANKNLVCLRIMRGTETLGWAVLLDTQMRDNKYFGNLRVGTIADSLATPENAASMVQAATRALEERGVDLIVANHSNADWGKALRSSGYLQGPSNFIFGASKPLAERLAPIETNRDRVYLMRGDGDGPVNL